jgi:hypothetical protein
VKGEERRRGREKEGSGGEESEARRGENRRRV